MREVNDKSTANSENLKGRLAYTLRREANINRILKEQGVNM
jgi:hypothetical protein